MTTNKPPIIPVEPGTLLRFFPQRDTGNWFVSGWTWRLKTVPFVRPQVFEVESYIYDAEGGHVTFKRENGTFVVFGGGRMEDIKFPYPHAMFEVIGDAEAAQIRLEWSVNEVINRATSPWGQWPEWLRWRTTRLVQA